MNHVDVPWGRGYSNLVSSRLTYTLTPRMFVSGLVQYQSRTDSVSTNARFRWEYRPGSELFVVYSDGRSTLTPRDPRRPEPQLRHQGHPPVPVLTGVGVRLRVRPGVRPLV